MPKKRVGVSLRKPSAPERAGKPAEASSLPSVTEPAVDSSAAETVRREATPPAVASADAAPAAPNDTLQVVAREAEGSPETAPQVLASVEIAPSAEPAPLTAALLASDPAASPVEKTIEAFVLGAAAALEQARNEAPVAQLQEVLRRGPEGYRELTVYLPEALAEALSVHCKENGLDLSQLLATVVEQHLNAARAAVNATLASENVLAVAARSLIGDLKGWVRSVLATRRIPGFRTASAAS